MRELPAASKGWPKRDAEDTVLRQIFKFAVKEEYLPVERMPTIGGKQNGSTNGNGLWSGPGLPVTTGPEGRTRGTPLVLIEAKH